MGSRMWNAVGKNLSHGGDLLFRIQQDMDAEKRRKEELARQDGIRAEETEYRSNRDAVSDRNYLQEWGAKRADMLRRQRLEEQEAEDKKRQDLDKAERIRQFTDWAKHNQGEMSTIDWATFKDLNDAALRYGVSNDPEVQEFLRWKHDSEQLDQRANAQSNRANPLDLLNARQQNALDLIMKRHENALEQIRARGVQSRSTKGAPSGGTRGGSNSAKSYDVNALESELAQVEATIKDLHAEGGAEYDMGMKKSINDKVAVLVGDAKRLRKLISEAKTTGSGVRIPSNAPANQADPMGLF